MRSLLYYRMLHWSQKDTKSNAFVTAIWKDDEIYQLLALVQNDPGPGQECSRSPHDHFYLWISQTIGIEWKLCPPKI